MVVESVTVSQNGYRLQWISWILFTTTTYTTTTTTLVICHHQLQHCDDAVWSRHAHLAAPPSPDVAPSPWSRQDGAGRLGQGLRQDIFKSYLRTYYIYYIVYTSILHDFSSVFPWECFKPDHHDWVLNSVTESESEPCAKILLCLSWRATVCWSAECTHACTDYDWIFPTLLN